MNHSRTPVVGPICRVLGNVSPRQGWGAILVASMLGAAALPATLRWQARTGRLLPGATTASLHGSSMAIVGPLRPGALIPTESIFAMEFSDDGAVLAAATDEGQIFILDGTTLEEVRQIDTGIILAGDAPFGGAEQGRSPWNGTYCFYCGGIAISPGDDLVAAVGLDGTVGAWRIDDGRPVFVSWGTHGGQYHAPTHGLLPHIDFRARFSSDGSVLAVIVYGLVQRLFRVSDGEDLPMLPAPVAAEGWAAATSGDLRAVVSHLWDPSRVLSLYLLRTSDWQAWHEAEITTSIQYAVEVSQDGSLAVAWTRTGGNLQVWRLSPDGATLGLLVQALASPDGFPTWSTGIVSRDATRFVALTWFANDGLSVETWDMSSEERLGKVSLARDVFAVRGDGGALATIEGDGRIVLRRLPDGAELASTD